MKRTVAIMQPYFMPYAGYFRLMSAADVFVIYDCVQFPKGGWVHRNRLPDAHGELRWLTLPIERPRLGTLISDISFLADAEAIMRGRLAPFPAAAKIDGDPLLSRLMEFNRTPLAYLQDQLQATAAHLGLSTQFILASSLAPDPAKAAAGRVIEMVQKLQGTDYVNAPGGRGLYDAVTFAAAGINLHFLADHPGPSTSMLHRLMYEDPAALREEIAAATRYEDSP